MAKHPRPHIRSGDRIQFVSVRWQYSDLATALRGLKSHGGAARAIERSGEEAVDSAHSLALAPVRQPDGSYRIGASFRCLLARA